MAMMRERAQVGGGAFDVESAPGEGATITVRFPISLLQQEGQDATALENSGGPRRTGWCFPRYIWNQRAGGRRFSPDRPSMTSTTKHANPT